MGKAAIKYTEKIEVQTVYKINILMLTFQKLYWGYIKKLSFGSTHESPKRCDLHSMIHVIYSQVAPKINSYYYIIS